MLKKVIEIETENRELVRVSQNWDKFEFFTEDEYGNTVGVYISDVAAVNIAKAILKAFKESI
jgi:hypothetical protein